MSSRSKLDNRQKMGYCERCGRKSRGSGKLTQPESSTRRMCSECLVDWGLIVDNVQQELYKINREIIGV